MAVREFNGSTDFIRAATGALSTNTFGTFAVIVKRGTTGAWHTFLALHSSGGSALTQWAYDSGDQAAMWRSVGPDTTTGPAAIATSAWGLVVYRKATGTATGRFSLYNFTTATWTHGAANAAMGDWTAPGASGTIRVEWETFDRLNGRIAVRAAWNSLPWTADTSGDTAIEAAGLHTSVTNWTAASPDAMWLFNQAAVTDIVTDATGNGADQTARTGTTVITDDDPPGFSFVGEPPVGAYLLENGTDRYLLEDGSGVYLLDAPGAPSIDLTPAVLTFVGVTLDPVPGAVTVTLTPAIVALSTQVLDAVPGVVSVTLTPATLAVEAQALDPQPIAPQVELTPAILAFAALALDPQPGAVSVALTPATVTLAAVTLDAVPGAVTVTLTPATVTLVPVPLDPVPGPVSITLIPAVITFEAQPLSIAGIGALNLEPVVLALTAQPLDPVPGPISTTLTPATFAVTAQAFDPVPIAVVVTLTPAVVAVVAVPMDPVPGPVAATLVPVLLTLIAVALSPSGVGLEDQNPLVLVYIDAARHVTVVESTHVTIADRSGPVLKEA